MYCILFILWNIYALEPKYITTVLMTNLSQCVSVWKFTLTLWNRQIKAFFCCTVWLHLNIRSGEVGAGEHQCWGLICFCSLLVFSVDKVFFFPFFLSCILYYMWMHDSCVYCEGEGVLEAAWWPFTVDVVCSGAPYFCCYVTALILFFL